MLNHQLNKEKIAKYYNSVVDIWPESDKWHSYTHEIMINYISKYGEKSNFNDQSLILNVGSAGNEYGILGTHYHVDIAEEKIKNIKNSFIVSAEKLPFDNDMFDGGLCVGSVINYCDPFSVISEISRTLKKGASFVLDFEQSNSWQFLGTKIYKSDASIITTFNSGTDDELWVFSFKHIKNILSVYNLIIKDKLFFHLLSPFFYKLYKDEQIAAKYSKLDNIMRFIPIINQKSCNIILTIQKV
jgi:ubiquinone/menaquinone biosynthesis C-methylase UbiE